MRPGSVCVGQGCRSKDGRYGTIQRFAAEVDGEQFIVVKFREGEELVSVLDLLPASQAPACVEEVEADVEEVVVGEVEDEFTFELEARGVGEDRDGELKLSEDKPEEEENSEEGFQEEFEECSE